MYKTFIWLHRWFGIALCLFFAVWFASGAVMLFVPFPSLDAEEFAKQAEPINLDRLNIAPASVVASVAGATDVRLIGVLGQPVYVLATAPGDRAISGVTGLRTPDLEAKQAGRIASAFGRSRVARISGPLAYDQWVVHQAFDHARPFYRVSLNDARATEIYVSRRTGEIVQQTRGSERAWNWAGAVVHWIYFVPIRKTFAVWDQTVWWIALVGTLMTVIGVGLGVYRTAKTMQSKRPRFSPFQGWLKWHHILGIAASLFVFTWIMSGWLSMDHGRLFSRGAAARGEAERYAGASLPQALTQASLPQLRGLGPASVLRFVVVDGRLIVAAGPGPYSSRVLSGRQTIEHTPHALVIAGLRAGWPQARISGPTPVTAANFYAKAEGVAPGADAYRLEGATRTTVFVDQASGRILAVVGPSRAAYDWIYYALHTFNFPGLVSRPLLRDLLVAPLLALGFALCVTSVVVGVRRVVIVTSP